MPGSLRFILTWGWAQIMIAIKDVTQWKDISKQPNHVYLMDGEKAVAYIKWGESAAVYFKTPLRLDKRHRKFIELRGSQNPFDVKVKVRSQLIEVIGSKGDTYFVDTEAKSCTCPGFVYRSQCKHIKELV